MRILAHPFSLDAAGAVRTIDDWSEAECRQIAAVIVATAVGERPLAPQFGLTDPVGRGVSAQGVVAAVELCEPDIKVLAVQITGPTHSRQKVAVTAVWRGFEPAPRYRETAWRDDL